MAKTDAISAAEDEPGSPTMRTAETLLRILPMPLCLAALVIMLKDSQTNQLGSLSYSDIGAFTYLVHASGVCAGYSLLSAVVAAVPRPSTMSRAWAFFLLDQVSLSLSLIIDWHTKATPPCHGARAAARTAVSAARRRRPSHSHSSSPFATPGCRFCHPTGSSPNMIHPQKGLRLPPSASDLPVPPSFPNLQLINSSHYFLEVLALCKTWDESSTHQLFLINIHLLGQSMTTAYQFLLSKKQLGLIRIQNIRTLRKDYSFK